MTSKQHRRLTFERKSRIAYDNKSARAKNADVQGQCVNVLGWPGVRSGLVSRLLHSVTPPSANGVNNWRTLAL